VLYLHHDQQGSTRLLTSTAGKTEATMTYDAYGNTLGTSGSATTQLGYDGQYTSSDSGLIYLSGEQSLIAHGVHPVDGWSGSKTEHFLALA
jgi:hypothetical protein